MKKDHSIHKTHELYGDFKLIPLPLDAVQQRIDFFHNRLEELLKVHYMKQDTQAVGESIKHKAFWQGIKEEHCLNKKQQGEQLSTGAYLFGKDEHGKRQPIEVEHLTDKERHDQFIGRPQEELVGWINMLCKSIVKHEEFLDSEGYVYEENPPQQNNDDPERHNIAGGLNRPTDELIKNTKGDDHD